MTRVSLHQLAYARSGDKGDICNIGVLAKSPAVYAHLRKVLTPQAIQAHFEDMVLGPVEVVPMANIHCLAIVMRGALGGGATTTLRYDQTGKAMGCALLRMEIEAPESLVEEAQERTCAIEGRNP